MILKNNIFCVTLKRMNILHILVVNILYGVLVFLTKPVTEYRIDVLFYPVYICFLLFPFIILYFGKQNQYITNPYCIIRFKSRLNAYLSRVRNLIIESMLFSLFFGIMIVVLNIILNGGILFYSQVMVFFTSHFTFIQIGLISCILKLRIPPCYNYTSSIIMFLIIVFDYFLSLGYFSIFFEFLSYPMMKVLMALEIVECIHSGLLLFIRCIVLFLVGLIIFNFKNEGASS